MSAPTQPPDSLLVFRLHQAEYGALVVVVPAWRLGASPVTVLFWVRDVEALAVDGYRRAPPH